jgi:hypothetical protein
MSDIRFNQWLHQSGTGGVSQDHIGNIGIGTTNPSIVVSAANTAVLNVGVITANNLFVNNAFNGDITGNVTGNISGATGTFSGNVDIADKIIHTGDTDTAMRFPADNTFAVDTAGSERFRITSAGLIGIGTVSPSGPIHAHVASGTQRSYLEASASHSFLRLKSGSTSYNSGLEFFSGASNIANVNGLGAGGLQFEVNGSERLRIDSTGRVGINTSTFADVRDSLIVAPPSGQNDAFFTLKTLSTNGNTRLQFADPDDTNVGDISYTHSNNAMVFKTADTERLRITSTGQLLLGINNAVASDVNFQIHGASSGVGPILNMTNDTGDCRIFFGQDDSSGGANAQGQIRYNVANNYLAVYAAGAERARIDSDGHLQIRREGVASVSGTDSRHTRYIVKQSNGQEAIVGSVFGQGQSGWGGDLVFATKDNNGNPSSGLTERMRLDHTGKLIIKGESNAELNLRPASGSGNDIISFENSGGTQRGNITYDTDNNFLFFNVSQSERTRIDQNGTLSHGTTQDNPGDANSNTGFAIRANGKYFFSCAADGGHMNRNNAGYVLHARYGGNFKGGVSVNSTQTNFNQTSDYRLKENIVNLDGAITRVKQLIPRRFNFIVEPDDTIDGFVAHEAATVVPESVTGTKDEVDSNGDPVYQGIDNGKLVPLLTAALQEAITKIETLEAAVTALQGS